MDYDTWRTTCEVRCPICGALHREHAPAGSLVPCSPECAREEERREAEALDADDVEGWT